MADDLIESLDIDDLDIEPSVDAEKKKEKNIDKAKNNFKDMEPLNEKMLNINNNNDINKNKTNLDDNKIYEIKDENKINNTENNEYNEYDDFNNEIITEHRK